MNTKVIVIGAVVLSLLWGVWLHSGTVSAEQYCKDYLFAGRIAPEMGQGFYVERIICLTDDDRMVPVEHPSDEAGIQALTEALLMELHAMQLILHAKTEEINAAYRDGTHHAPAAIYINEENQ